MIARYIQGIRVYCSRCEKQITPTTMVENNADGVTVGIELHCDCGNIISKMKV